MATLLTIVGQRKFLEAEVTGKKVEFAEYALGDGIGVTEGQTSLTSEKFRHAINDVKVVEGGILVECHVPKEAEGFTIREVGLFDVTGDLIVVSDYPETDRLVTEDSDTLIIQVIVGISNTESATINVDASELMASQQSVNLALEESKRYTDAKVGNVDFSEIERKIEKLETEDKRLHVLVAENAEAIQNLDAEELQKKGELAEERGLVAEERGEVARVKGSLAEASAEKADRASERANEMVKELESYEHAGAWQAGEYKKNQEVLHEGSTYRAVKDTTTEPPSSEWQLIARKGTDGKGSVVTVNGVSPNEEGDVDLGELVAPNDVDSAVGKALETSKAYTDQQIEAIPEVDTSHLETKEDAIAKLNEAKAYTDEAIGDVDLSEIEQQLTEHSSKIATKDDLGHIRVGRGLSITEDGVLSVPSVPTIYGVEIDEDNSDPFGAVTYIADSEGFEPLYTGDGNVDLGSWGDKFPINKVKIVLMKDGEVVEELDENDHTKTVDGRSVDITSGDSGDVMTAIPLTYWKLERVGSKLRIYVSERKVDEDYKAYAHSRDGVVQDDYLYIGTYKGNVQDDKLRSLHDVMSTGSETIGKFRTYAEANGEGYSQQYWGAMTLMQIFTVLLTKSTDSQSALGRGYVDGNSEYIKNGGTTKKGLFYGEKSGKEQMKFLGIEDFWGNRYEWVDGLVTDPNRMWLINDKNTNYNDAGDGYTKHGECFGSDGYISQVDGKTDTGFIPVKTSGSSSTYYADIAWQSSDGSRVACFGGFRSYGSIAGAFLLSAGISASSASAYRGARLLYLKGGK